MAREGEWVYSAERHVRLKIEMDIHIEGKRAQEADRLLEILLTLLRGVRKIEITERW